MPLPFLLVPIGAAIAAAAGVGAGVHGAKKMKDAKDTMNSAKARHESNMKRFKKENELTLKEMDRLGKTELEILHSFSDFSDLFEKIKNRPVFEEYSKDGVSLPEYNGEKIKEVSVGAGVLLGGLGGAGLGAAGGFAAAGATTSAVMALGTASTGIPIASLSGAAATNATLAVLGGGTLAAGGAGVAGGAAVLGAATLGVGLLVGGIIFNFTGSKISDKADEAWQQMKNAEEKIDNICDYLGELRKVANKYCKTLENVNNIYQQHIEELKEVVDARRRINWKTFTPEEKILTENTVLLVGLLYDMCKVEIVHKNEDENGINTINNTEVEEAVDRADFLLADKF